MKYLTLPLALVLGIHLNAHVVQDNVPIPQADDDPTDEEYHKHEILGWTVHISSEDMSDRPETSEAALWMVRSKLRRIVEVVPMNKVKLLRTVEIWINDNWEEGDELCGWACYVNEGYRGSGRFLRDRDGSVIIRDMDYLLDAAWCCSSSTFLHELAHAYHDQFLEDGFNNREIDDEYEDARDSGDYDDNRVLYPWWEEQYREHYGMKNAREFFATMSETYFLGMFTTYPHNLRDLYHYDRSAYNLIYRAWFSENISGGIVSFSEGSTVSIPEGLEAPSEP